VTQHLAIGGSHRRRLAVTVGLLLAASAAFATTAVIVSSQHRAAQLNVNPGGGGGTHPGGVLGSGEVVPAADLVSDPVFVNSEIGFALATTEHANIALERLARSSDGGRSWRVTGAQFPVTGRFSTLQFTSPDDGYVFGPAGLLVTSNGGRSWSQVQGLNGTLQRVIPLKVADGSVNVWATYTSCGSGPPSPTAKCSVGLAISLDDGRHWRDETTTGLSEARGGGDILARWTLTSAYVLSYGATGGGLAYTANDGRTWRSLADPCSAPYARVDLAAPPPPPGDATGMWLICGAITRAGEEGQPKLVYRSYDGGKHWMLVASTGFTPVEAAPVGEIPLSGWVSQLATITPTIAWLGIRGVGIIVTRDSGRTWQLVSGMGRVEPDTEVGVTFNSTTLGWAIVFRRAVWRTEDAVRWVLMDGR
jgi:hypothetical protein